MGGEEKGDGQPRKGEKEKKTKHDEEIKKREREVNGNGEEKGEAKRKGKEAAMERRQRGSNKTGKWEDKKEINWQKTRWISEQAMYQL